MKTEAGQGALVVVGTGIALVRQCTPEAQRAIETADLVFAVVDPITLQWLCGLNAKVVDLQWLYQHGRARRDTYEQMTEQILAPVRSGAHVCAVFYGHPGVFVRPSHAAIAAARGEGFQAQMLPGVSAEDCLIADLGVDPGGGWQAYEAHDFVLRAPRFEPSAALVLWQVGVLGEPALPAARAPRWPLELLRDILLETYPAAHEVVVYEASALPPQKPIMERMALADLAEAHVTQHSTLYVPAAVARVISSHRAVMLQQREEAG